MTEGEQQAPQQEVRKENPVVSAARGAVRTAIETDEAYHDWKDTLTAKDKSVYRAWADAVDNFHASMSDRDRRRLSTKLETVKIKLKGALSQVMAPVLDFAVDHLGKVGKLSGLALLGTAALPAVALTGPLIGASAILYGSGVALDAMRPKKFVQKGGLFLRKLPVPALREDGASFRMKKSAELWEARKKGEYKKKIRKEQIKDIGSVVKQRTKDILTGFAFPEGRAQ